MNVSQVEPHAFFYSIFTSFYRMTKCKILKNQFFKGEILFYYVIYLKNVNTVISCDTW